jgi:outer membrane protein
MNKLLLSCSKLLLAGVLGTVLAHAQGARVATVDMNRVFTNYFKTKAAETQLKDQAAEADKSFRSMIDDYKKANEDYRKLVDQSNDQAVASEERERRRKSAESKLMEVQEIEKSVKQFEAQARTSIGELEKRSREKIVAEIREVVNRLGRSGGYSLVVDTSALSGYALQTPIILYSNGENDLTDAVIKEINARAACRFCRQQPAERRGGGSCVACG